MLPNRQHRPSMRRIAFLSDEPFHFVDELSE